MMQIPMPIVLPYNGPILRPWDVAEWIIAISLGIGVGIRFIKFCWKEK